MYLQEHFFLDNIKHKHRHTHTQPPKQLYLAVLHVVFPVASVGGTIGIVEGSVTMPQTVDKLPIEHVAHRVLGARHAAQQPDVLTHPMLVQTAFIYGQVDHFTTLIYSKSKNLAARCADPSYAGSNSFHLRTS